MNELANKFNDHRSQVKKLPLTRAMGLNYTGQSAVRTLSGYAHILSQMLETWHCYFATFRLNAHLHPLSMCSRNDPLCSHAHLPESYPPIEVDTMACTCVCGKQKHTKEEEGQRGNSPRCWCCPPVKASSGPLSYVQCYTQSAIGTAGLGISSDSDGAFRALQQYKLERRFGLMPSHVVLASARQPASSCRLL